MTFVETRLQGAFVIGLDIKDDFRGHFARTFCIEEFQKHGLNPRVVQCNSALTTPGHIARDALARGAAG